MKILGIVVPCYNEQEVFSKTNEILLNKLLLLIKSKKISSKSFILYVDDGSKDNTLSIIKDLYDHNDHISYISLGTNRGHQNALYAGLIYIKDMIDISISIDADLQDDICAIDDMIDNYYKGYDIVLGVRDNRESDSLFKRLTAQLFYRLMNLLGANTIYNHADYRLLSADCLKELDLYQESHLFLRGIISILSYNRTVVYYKRNKRFAGVSKYPLKKMLSFAYNGITSFSIKPLTIILYLGLCTIFICIIFVIYSLYRHFSGATIDGWTSTFISIWFIGGVQLSSLGIIGSYIGKNFMESKKRPRFYIVECMKAKNYK